ncbi:MAG: hypothetical protein Q9200_006796 [Gallowayella weberi]
MLFLPTFLLFALLPLILGAEDFYNLLGISKSASERDIKKAYRTLSKRYHPDKNPNDASAKQKFVSIADAYDALSDPTSRQIYDRYGHEGLAQHRQQSSGGGQQHDPFDLFSRFFGGSGHFGHNQGQRRGPDMERERGRACGDMFHVRGAWERGAETAACAGDFPADADGVRAVSGAGEDD